MCLLGYVHTHCTVLALSSSFLYFNNVVRLHKCTLWLFSLEAVSAVDVVFFTQTIIRTWPQGGRILGSTFGPISVTFDTMLKHPFALGLVCHCAYLSIISTGFISALLNRNDEMVNILGSYCSRLHHHLKDSMGNLSLSLIHSPLQAGYKHTHSYRSCMSLERVHISICNLYVSVSACFTCF